MSAVTTRPRLAPPTTDHRALVRPPKITLLIRFIQKVNRVAHVTSHRGILYGPLNRVLRLDIFTTYTAIYMHLAAFH